MKPPWEPHRNIVGLTLAVNLPPLAWCGPRTPLGLVLIPHSSGLVLVTLAWCGSLRPGTGPALLVNEGLGHLVRQVIGMLHRG